MTDDIPEWAKQMACDEVHDVVDSSGQPWLPCDATPKINRALYTLAKRIARTEKPPIDPDLLAAREICAKHYEASGLLRTAASFRSGAYDNNHSIALTLAGIKYGREHG